MTGEIAVRTNENLTEKMEWSKAMQSSSLIPQQYRNSPANLLFAVEYADALGVERINALTSIHVIEGKPTASAELIAGLVRRAGHKLRVSGDDKSATAELIRADDPEFTYTARWDIARAQTAGLANKGVWRNYPAAMLRARAITEVARMGASDALLGVVYTPEELGADVDAVGNPRKATGIVPTDESGRSRMGALLGVSDEVGPTSDAPTTSFNVDESTGEIIEADWGNPPLEGSDAEWPTPAPLGKPATEPQMKKIAVMMRKLGLTDSESALNFVNDVLDAPVASSKDLSSAQASKVIDALEKEEGRVGA